MPVIKEQELKKQISSGEFSPVYLFIGDEDYLKKHYATLIATKCVSPDFRDFNYHKFDGTSCSIDEIYEAAEAIPLMGGRSCVFVKDLQVDKLKEGESEILFSMLGDPADFCVTVFLMENVSFPKNNAKCKQMLKAVEKCGSVCELEKKSRSELCEILEKGAKKRSCVLDRNNSAYLVDYVGNDMTVLFNELEKLCFFAEGREIVRSDIEKVCIRSLDTGAFDLARSMTSGTSEKAFELLEELFAQKTEPVVLLGSLISVYADMYRAKAALEAGERSDAAASCFNYKNKEFRLRNAGRIVARLSMPELRNCIEELNTADTKLKSSMADQRMVLEKLILRLMLITK